MICALIFATFGAVVFYEDRLAARECKSGRQQRIIKHKQLVDTKNLRANMRTHNQKGFVLRAVVIISFLMVSTVGTANAQDVACVDVVASTPRGQGVMHSSEIRRISILTTEKMKQYPEHFDYIPDVNILVKIFTDLLDRSPDAIAFMSYVDAKSKRRVGRYSEEEFERIRKSGLLGKWVRYLDANKTPADVEFDKTYGNLAAIVYDPTTGIPERWLPYGGTIRGKYFAAITMFIAAHVCEAIGKELKID